MTGKILIKYSVKKSTIWNLYVLEINKNDRNDRNDDRNDRNSTHIFLSEFVKYKSCMRWTTLCETAVLQ